MLMNKFEQWSLTLPYIREWILGRVTTRYYEDFFDKIKGRTVLEIGCGNGAGAKTIKKYFSPKKIVASDLDSRMITHALTSIHDPVINFEVADAAELPYKNKSFNAVFDYVAIHHIPSPDWRRCLDELYRVLKPGGYIFIYDIAIEAFNTLWGRIIRLVTDHPYDSMYKELEFKSYLKKVGFKILKEAKDTYHFVIVSEKQ